MNALRVSAAICTRDRPRQLARALASLDAQTPAVAEILVVDNAPRDDVTRRLVAERHPLARYVLEPLAGLDFARNRAMREANGEVVAFLDDDAVADPGWASALVAAFEQGPQVGACTGRVEALALETEAQRVFEANGGYARGVSRVVLPRDGRRRLRGLPVPLIAWAVSVGNGCSLALRRDVVLALGGFDEALDRGPLLPGGGDLDVLWRVLLGGWEVVYEPAALARHEHRRDLHAVVEQLAGHQRAFTAMLVKSAVCSSGRRLPVLAFLAWRLLKPGIRLARGLVGRDPLPARALARMWWSCWLGLGSYPFWRLRPQRSRRVPAPT